MDIDITSLILIVILLFSLSVHEFAHAWVATKLWDPTPKIQGRLTLNPIAHIDPIGLIMLFIVRIGWAKPVMINPRYFENPLRDELLVALAGPFSNLLIAFLATGLASILVLMNWNTISWEIILLNSVAKYNVYLAIFNLIPIPPLDGYRIVQYFYPQIQTFIAQYYYQIALFTFIIFITFQGQLFIFLEHWSNIILLAFAILRSLILSIFIHK